MGTRCEMPPPVLGSGLRRRRDEDDISDLESSPSRRRKVVPTVDLTKGEKLACMTQGLNIVRGDGYPYRTSDIQFDPWMPGAQPSIQSHAQKCFQQFNLKPAQDGQVARPNSFYSPHKAGLYNTPLGLPKINLPSPQSPGSRTDWAIGALSRAPFRADSPPSTPKRASKSHALLRAMGQAQLPHSPPNTPAQSPYSKTASRTAHAASPPLVAERHCELELDSTLYNGHLLRERKTVELHDGTFLRIAVIKNRISDDGEDQIFLQGPKFQRAREFLGLLALKKNEVAMSSLSETIPLSEVLKPRILIVTNANFPKYRDITGIEETDEREGRLICRWRITMLNKQEGYIWRLQEHEVDKEYRTDDSELRESWRGRLVKMVEMLQKRIPQDKPPASSNDLYEKEGFIERNVRRNNFIDLTTGKRKQTDECAKETHHTEIITNDSSLELNQMSYAPFRRGDSSETGSVGSSHYEATIDSRTPAGRFLGYFQGTYTPNLNTPLISSNPSPRHNSTDNPALGINSPPPTPSKTSEPLPPRPLIPSLSDSDLWNSDQKQFGVFRDSSFLPFNSLPSKQTYSTSGRPLTFAEGNFRPSLFFGDTAAQKSTFRSNVYDNLKRSVLPSKVLAPLDNNQPSTPKRYTTLPAKLGLPSISEDLESPGSPSTPSKDSPGKRDFRHILTEVPPPQPVFRPSAKRKYKFGDAFCGGGGMSSGARSAGLINAWSFDFNIDAVTTYTRNFPDCETYFVSASDFVALPPEDLLVDVVHLSPPCQPHSPAHTIAGKDDDRNEASLFCIKECLEVSRPRMVTLEQTDGILNRQEWFRSLVMCFTDLGFSISWKVLHGVEYGVPQTRKRLFILAASPGESLPNFPTPKYAHPRDKHLRTRLPPARTVRNAIGCIPHGSTCHNPLRFPTGFRPSPVDFDQPLKATILASGGPYDVHPNGLRPFTPRELACLQTFPVTHDFSGSTFQKKKQIGNAVPPALAEALLREVRRAMEKADRERSKKLGDADTKKDPAMADAWKEVGPQTVISIPDDEENEVEVLGSQKDVLVVNVD